MAATRGKPFAKGNTLRRDGRSGRKKGTTNGVTALVKSFLDAYDRLGGVEWLLKVARKHPVDFLRVFSKLLPSRIEASLADDRLRKEAAQLSDDELLAIVNSAPSGKDAEKLERQERRELK